MSIRELKEEFLRDDLRDALKGLFVGAITWLAHPESKDHHYLRGLGMFTALVQARALYEFFYKPEHEDPKDGGNASAYHFSSKWKPCNESTLYSNYMSHGAPAQKRVFHLVYGRSGFPGGTAADESDHLKNQVLAFAEDLNRLTKDFAACVDVEYRPLVESSLREAINAAKELAAQYQIPNPFS